MDSRAAALKNAPALPERGDEPGWLAGEGDVISASIAAAKAAEAASAGEGGGDEASDVAVRLTSLTSRFQKVLGNNDTVPDLEKMERFEFVIDR